MICCFLLFYKHRRIFLWLKNQQNLDLQTREVLVLFFSCCASCLLDLINSIATTQKCSCVNSCSISLALDLSGGYLTSFVFALAHTKSTHSNKRRRVRVFFYCEKIQLSCFVVEIIADGHAKSGASDDPGVVVLTKSKACDCTRSNPCSTTKKRPMVVSLWWR